MHNLLKSLKYSTGLLPKLRQAMLVWIKQSRYWGICGYRSKKYWSERHSKYGFDLRGVGIAELSHEKNLEMYGNAAKVFVNMCRDEGIDFPNISMLDIGCGTGFYAKLFFENRGKQYLGIDITDIFFEKLRKSFPSFRFRELDISTGKMDGEFDLVIMIDVTQHIVSPKKFSFAMQNVQSCLREDGVFIVTSWLSNSGRLSFYEVSRSMEAYTLEFPESAFSIGNPIPFRDKFIFHIKKLSLTA